MFEQYLLYKGWVKFDPSNPIKREKVFAYEDDTEALRIFYSPENVYGEYIKIIISRPCSRSEVRCDLENCLYN